MFSDDALEILDLAIYSISGHQLNDEDFKKLYEEYNSLFENIQSYYTAKPEPMLVESMSQDLPQKLRTINFNI